MTRKSLTPRQHEIYQFICWFHDTYGFAPTIREMMERFGIGSTNGVREHLQALQRKGWIYCLPGQSRAISITQDQQAAAKRYAATERFR